MGVMVRDAAALEDGAPSTARSTPSSPGQSVSHPYPALGQSATPSLHGNNTADTIPFLGGVIPFRLNRFFLDQ